MQLRSRSPLCWLLLFLGASGVGCRHADPADVVLRHGAIYPLAGDTLQVESLAIRDGRVVYLGEDRVAARLIGRSTRVIELAGRMVLPGFRDTHVHPRGGVSLAECALDGLRTRVAVLDSVRRCAQALPESAWVRGRGWQLPVFPSANPRKEWLDDVAGGRRVYLVAADGHSGWASSRALEAAGIDRGSRDPERGRIERDASGEPSGTLRESAMDLVAAKLPRRTQDELRAGLQRAIQLANSYGIVALHDAAADAGLLEAYAALDSAGQLNARIVAAIEIDPGGGPGQLDSLRAWRGRFEGRRYFSPHAAKLFVDGVIEAKTAALLAPYLGEGDNRGEPNFSAGTLDTLVAAIDAAGFQVHQHAIGDRAVRMALDALAFARRHNGPRDARPLIAHLQLIDPADIPRFATLGVIPSFQPLWAWADEYITALTVPVLGAERSRWLYPIGSVARSGARLAAGSDWSVSSLNPLEGIQVAITRRAPDAGPGPAWIPEEVVDLETMLIAYTAAGAYAAGEEATAGTLELGKAADLIVLDRDLYRIPSHEIHSVRVLLTLLEGREVWRDRAF